MVSAFAEKGIKVSSSIVIMTRSKTKTSMRIYLKEHSNDLICIFLAPHEFTSIPFPVKALKIILHDVQSGGEAATFSAQSGGDAFEIESDDGVSVLTSHFDHS